MTIQPIASIAKANQGREQRLAHARAIADAMLAGVQGSAVDSLIADRRDEERRELAKER